MVEVDAGPPPELGAIFVRVPDYGPFRDFFWFDWGPTFYRGRLDGSARVLCVASDPGGDTSGLAVLCADREHELPAQRRHAAALVVTVDRDSDRRPLARPEARDHLRRNSDTRGGLAAELRGGAKSQPTGIFSAVRGPGAFM